MEVKPSAYLVQGPAVGASGSQVAPTLPGLIRQICEVPGVAGKPRSSPTYQAPSGPTATDVATASDGIGVPAGGSGPPASGGSSGRPSGTATTRGSRRATVEIVPPRSTLGRSLPAASATSTLPSFKAARPNGLLSAGTPSRSAGSGSVSW